MKQSEATQSEEEDEEDVDLNRKPAADEKNAERSEDQVWTPEDGVESEEEDVVSVADSTNVPEEDDVALAEELQVAEVDDIDPGELEETIEAWKCKEGYESSGDEGIADRAFGPKESRGTGQESYLQCMLVVSMHTKEDPHRPYIHTEKIPPFLRDAITWFYAIRDSSPFTRFLHYGDSTSKNPFLCCGDTITDLYKQAWQ